jgi:hypothetical protein
MDSNFGYGFQIYRTIKLHLENEAMKKLSILLKFETQFHLHSSHHTDTF